METTATARAAGRIRLIVNADDGGVDAARNRGILRAGRDGIVRSVTVLASGRATRSLIERAGEAGMGIGLHINLSEGEPLAAGHRTLADPSGRFLGKRALLDRALAGGIDPEEAAREGRAQWEWLEAVGVSPTHADGHHHAHLFPGIAEALPGALPPGTWVRLPLEAGLGGRLAAEPVASPAASDSLPGPGFDPYAEPRRLARWLAARSAAAAALWAGRLRFLESGFHGLALIGGYGPPDLIALLESLQPGTHELMVHPGETDLASVPFSALAARERELEALCDPAVGERARALGVELIHFGDLR